MVTRASRAPRSGEGRGDLVALLLHGDVLRQAGEHLGELRRVLGGVAGAPGALGDLLEGGQVGHQR